MKLLKTRESDSGRQSPELSPPLARERRECCAPREGTRFCTDFAGTPLTERQPPSAIAPMTTGNGLEQGRAQMRKSRKQQDSGGGAFWQDQMPAARHARTTENVFSDYFSQLTPMYPPAPAQTPAAAPKPAEAEAEAEEYIPELSAFEQEAWDKDDEPFTPEQQRQELGAQVEQEHARQRQHLQMMIAQRKQARGG